MWEDRGGVKRLAPVAISLGIMAILVSQPALGTTSSLQGFLGWGQAAFYDQHSGVTQVGGYDIFGGYTSPLGLLATF